MLSNIPLSYGPQRWLLAPGHGPDDTLFWMDLDGTYCLRWHERWTVSLSLERRKVKKGIGVAFSETIFVSVRCREETFDHLTIYRWEHQNLQLQWLSFRDVQIPWWLWDLHSPLCKNREGVNHLPSLGCCSDTHISEWLWFSWDSCYFLIRKELCLNLGHSSGQSILLNTQRTFFSEVFLVHSSWVFRGGSPNGGIWMFPKCCFGHHSPTVFWSDHVCV